MRQSPAGHCLLDVGTHLCVEFGQPVGRACREFRIFGLDPDKKQALRVWAAYPEPLLKSFENPLIHAVARGIALNAEKNEGAGTKPKPLRRRIEFAAPIDPKLLDDPAGKIPRGEKLSLACRTRKPFPRVQIASSRPQAYHAQTPGPGLDLRLGVKARRL